MMGFKDAYGGGRKVIKSYAEKDRHGEVKRAKRSQPGKRRDLISRIARKAQARYG
jgi:hypothetical protein